MSSRAFLMFASGAPCESRRIDLLVIQVPYAVCLLMILLLEMGSQSRSHDSDLLKAVTLLHAAVAMFSTIPFVAEVYHLMRSQSVGLLCLTGISGRDAVGGHLLLTAMTFSSVWVVRVPILFLVHHLGGATWNQILYVEALLLGMFVVTYVMGAFLATYPGNNPTAIFSLVFPILLEFALWLTSATMTSVQTRMSFSLPPSMDNAFIALNHLRISSCLPHLMKAPYPSVVTLWPLALHLGIALLCIWGWQHRYFNHLDYKEHSTEYGNQRPPFWSAKSMSRPSRPVWRDAICWQAFHVHFNGRIQIIVRLVYVLLATTLFLYLFGLSRNRQQINAYTGLLMFSTAICRFIYHTAVGQCLQNEIRGKTLQTLLLTPNSCLDLCDGWRRGVRRFSSPDVIVCAVCLFFSLLYSPGGLAPAYIGIMILIQASGPFFVLVGLLPLSRRAIGTGLALILCWVSVVGIAVNLSLRVHSWLGPAVLLIVNLGWNRLVRALIPKWFAQKLDELV